VIRVGLTGNIGSGKTTVAKVWADMGAKIIDADVIAKEVLEPDSEASRRVVEVFGKGVLDGGGSLDRKKLAERVFNNPDALSTLNEIVHPAVISRIETLMKNEPPGGRSIFVVEAALILECGREKDYDIIVVVDAALEKCVERVIAERGLDRTLAGRIAKSQMKPDSKKERADFVINNDGDLNDLRAEAARVFRELDKLADRAQQEKRS